jgi:trans-aconitate methyltransferase
LTSHNSRNDDPAHTPPLSVSDATADYRDSHKGRGRDYDLTLNQDPWDRYMARRERDIVEKLLDQHFPNGVGTYLDFACGTGRLTSVVELRSKTAVGIDISDSMLAVAASTCLRANFLKCDITRQPAPVKDVDLVTSFRFFGNAQQELRREVLAALSALLRPGGLLILNNHRNSAAPLIRLARWRGNPDPADLSSSVLNALVRDAGLTVESIHGIGLWYVQHRPAKDWIVSTRLGPWLDKPSALLGLYRICPDYVMVCRKR